jgi:serine protease inhibitor
MSQRARDLAFAAAVGALLIAACSLPGCGGGSGSGTSATPESVNPGGPAVSVPPAVQQAKDENTPVDAAIVTADNAFGLNVLNTLIPGNAGNNTAIAPISVAMALQIAYNGAVGPTQQAMAQTLQLGGLSVTQLNSDNAALLAALLDPDPQVDLTIANSLWVPLSTDTVSPAFVSADQTYYGAEVGDIAGAPANVNAWVAAQTQGAITQILKPGDYVTVLANAVYFKGQWTNGFPPSQTLSLPFTLADGTQTTVLTMQQTGAFAYFQGTNFQAVSLPYGQGRLSMLLVLPAVGVDLEAFVAGITPAAIDSWVSQMHSGAATVSLNLPRFTTSFGTSLVPTLTTLGMGSAFDPNAGGLSGIVPGGYISDVEHKTYVQVDESGTIAAAATTITITTTVEVPSVNVYFNHPFFYAIRDNQTGELLFVGVLMNPNAG